MISETNYLEDGQMGRVAYGRIAPNEDLVQSVEKLCIKYGFKNAFVRGALGSLVDATLQRNNTDRIYIRGPAVEVVSIAGEVRQQSDGSLLASLSGVVADTNGEVQGGFFVPGQNTVCMTFEVTLEEWLPNNSDKHQQ